MEIDKAGFTSLAYRRHTCPIKSLSGRKDEVLTMTHSTLASPRDSHPAFAPTGGRRFLIIGSALVALVASSLAACGGGSSSPAPANTPSSIVTTTAPANTAVGSPALNPTRAAASTAALDPCSLLTQAEVDKAVGQPLKPGKQVATLLDCNWTTSDFTAGVDVTVSGWTEIKAAANGNGAHPASIAGVGDEALNLNGANGSLLYVRKGSQGFLLTINGPHIDSNPDHGLAQEKVLAVAVLGRLH